jgi:hypothetical protein
MNKTSESGETRRTLALDEAYRCLTKLGRLDSDLATIVRWATENPKAMQRLLKGPTLQRQLLLAMASFDDLPDMKEDSKPKHKSD